MRRCGLLSFYGLVVALQLGALVPSSAAAYLLVLAGIGLSVDPGEGRLLVAAGALLGVVGFYLAGPPLGALLIARRWMRQVRIHRAGALFGSVCSLVGLSVLAIWGIGLAVVSPDLNPEHRAS